MTNQDFKPPQQAGVHAEDIPRDSWEKADTRVGECGHLRGRAWTPRWESVDTGVGERRHPCGRQGHVSTMRLGPSWAADPGRWAPALRTCQACPARTGHVHRSTRDSAVLFRRLRSLGSSRSDGQWLSCICPSYWEHVGLSSASHVYTGASRPVVLFLVLSSEVGISSLASR